ncbi:hypothetical protein Tco_0427533 [Tanacetum coccineum]
MSDSIGGLVSLGDEIFSEGKESRELNIGGGTIAGRAIITWGGGIVSYAIIKGDEGEIEWDVRRRSKNSLSSLCKSENETLANVHRRYPSPSSFRYHHQNHTAIAPPSSPASRHRDHRRHAFTVAVVTFTIVTPLPSQSPSLSLIQRHQGGVHFDLVKRKQVKELAPGMRPCGGPMPNFFVLVVQQGQQGLQLGGRRGTSPMQQNQQPVLMMQQQVNIDGDRQDGKSRQFNQICDV